MDSSSSTTGSVFEGDEFRLTNTFAQHLGILSNPPDQQNHVATTNPFLIPSATDPSVRNAVTNRVMMSTLETENSLLKGEVNSLNKMNQELRLDLTRLQNITAMQKEAAVREEVAQLHSALGEHQSRLHAATREIQELREANGTLTTTCGELEQKVEECRKMLQKGIEEYSSVYNSTCNQVREWSLHIQQFIMDVLPTFKAITGSSLGDNYLQQLVLDCAVQNQFTIQTPVLSASGYSVDKDLNVDMNQVDTGLRVLKQVVQAKMETLLLVRNKIREENGQLYTQLEKVQNEYHNTENALLENEASWKYEKDTLWKEFEQLKDAYGFREQELQQSLSSCNDQLHTLTKQKGDLQTECEDLQSTIADLKKDLSDANNRAAEEEDVRARLIAELNQQKDVVAVQATELDALKMQCKVFGCVGDSTDKPTAVGKEKEDLIRMIDKLLAENSELKSQTSNLSVEVSNLKKQTMQQRYLSSDVQQHEVSLVVKEKVSDAELTSKILRKNLEQTLGVGQSTTTTPPAPNNNTASSPWGILAQPRQANKVDTTLQAQLRSLLGDAHRAQRTTTA